jgi:opacity protein-like surface antigen
MHAKLAILSLLGVFLISTDASAQGLLALQNQDQLRESQPLAFTLGASGGYDRLDYKSDRGGLEDIDSFFIQGTLGTIYSDADAQTPWSVGADVGVLNYLDDLESADDTYYNARLAFNIVHKASQRLRLANNFYATYEVEPNYAVGASTALRNGQYIYGYENFAVSYAWSERMSTTTSYTLDGIRYDDDDLASTEDRLSHIIAQQFSYSLNRNTKIVGEYRYRITDYDSASNDYTSHYILAGIDQAWSERTSGSFRAGAELYESDRVEETAPYFEVGVNHATSKKTSVHFYGSVGFDGAELGDYDSRYAYRTGATANHRVTERLAVNGGLHYVYSDYEGNAGTTQDVTEQQVHASAGLAYRLWNNVSMDAQYSYTLLNSDDELREYDRNRVSLGLSAQF